MHRTNPLRPARRTAEEIEAAPVSRRLPVAQGHMSPTPGPRDENCALYSDCLAAHVFAHIPRRKSGQPSREELEMGKWTSCPDGCRWREHRERATDYMYHPDGGHLARAGST